jgi:hypothetical protein
MDAYNEQAKGEKEFNKRLLLKILELVRLGYGPGEVAQKIIEFFNEFDWAKYWPRILMLYKLVRMREMLVELKLSIGDSKEHCLEGKDIKKIIPVFDSAINLLQTYIEKEAEEEGEKKTLKKELIEIFELICPSSYNPSIEEAAEKAIKLLEKYGIREPKK